MGGDVVHATASDGVGGAECTSGKSYSAARQMSRTAGRAGVGGAKHGTDDVRPDWPRATPSSHMNLSSGLVRVATRGR